MSAGRRRTAARPHRAVAPRLGRPVTGHVTATWGMIHRAVPDDRLDEARDELIAGRCASAAVVAGPAEVEGG